MVINLPPGKWSIIGKGNEITEEVAAGLVDKFNNGAYRDYKYKFFYPDDDFAPFYLTVTESLHSRIRSLGHIPDECLLIEKVK